MKILSILGGGHFLSPMYRRKNLMGIVWGLLKFQFYLSIYF